MKSKSGFSLAIASQPLCKGREGIFLYLWLHTLRVWKFSKIITKWFDLFICLNQGHPTKNYWFIFPNSRSRTGRPNPTNPTKFIVNHPFVFFLRDAQSGVLLFQVRDLFVIFESFLLYISILLFHFFVVISLSFLPLYIFRGESLIQGEGR